MKILYTTDWHISDRCPVSRTEGPGYLDALMAKVDDIWRIAKNEGVDVTLFGGDLFDTKDPSPLAVRRLSDALASWPTPIHATIGNHDVGFMGAKGFSDTWLGLLSPSVLPLRYGWPEEARTYHIGENVTLTQVNYFRGIEAWIEEKMKAPAGDDVHILMAHANIVPDRAMFRTVSYDALAGKWDFVLVSHWHTGYPVVDIGGTLFVAPGSMTRRGRDTVDIPPRVAILDTIKLTAEYIPLPSARPLSEIFRVEDWGHRRETASLDNFVRGLQSGGVNAVDPVHRVEKAATELGIDTAVRELAVEVVAEQVTK